MKVGRLTFSWNPGSVGTVQAAAELAMNTSSMMMVSGVPTYRKTFVWLVTVHVLPTEINMMPVGPLNSRAGPESPATLMNVLSYMTNGPLSSLQRFI